MPVPYLAPFSSFEQTTFHVGGSPETVAAIGTKWVNFGQQATAAAAALRAINDGGYIGTEGEKYKELVNSQLPGHLDVTGKAHEAVGNAINKYFHALTDCLSKMGLLVTKSRGDHGMVQAAVTRYNAAELAAAAAKTKAGVAKGAALLGSVTPAGPALAATAATAETAAATAEAERAAAWAHYEAVKATWDGDVSQAGVLKNQLGTDVTTQVGVIDTQARKRFQENPTGLSAVWAEIKNFVSKHADVLSFIADALSIIGGILLLIPGLNIIGAVLVGVGLGLKALLAATGNGSWADFAFELVTSLPGGALLKGGKMAFKGAKAAFKGANAIGKGGKVGKALSTVKKTASNIAEKARGLKCKVGLDPVDMATGAMVNYQIDVSIDGILPLVIDRNSNSGHELGRALGPQWVSRMDCRIEICPDEVLMLTPDGALVTFPAAPLDGSEVRADGRPWLLSFTDGAYRVRDVASGLVYVFATATEMSMVRPVGPIEDVTNLYDPSVEPNPEMVGVTVGGYGYRSASITDYAGVGFEVGLSALIHRTGHMIEYGWDQASGLMTSMRRSDGTVLELIWDKRTHRMASVWLKHEDHPDEEAERLISYEYDAHGRLRRVINTAPGYLSYHYDEANRVCGWTDRNGVSYTYVFDDQGRVTSQAGTGGIFANAAVWLDDLGTDAPEGGKVCVTIETAGKFLGDPLELGDDVISDRLERLEALPLVKTLRQGGLAAAGLTGGGRDGVRSNEAWQLPDEWLHDEILGDLRPTVYRSTVAGDVWRIVSPSGTCEDYTYNQYHDVVETISASEAIFSTKYDEFGCVIERDFPDGTTEIYQQASWGTPARIIGRDGLTTEVEVDIAGNIVAVTDPSGLTTTFEYEWLPSGLVSAGSVSPAGIRTLAECDAAGRMIATDDGAGRRWSVVRDIAGRVVESMDPSGNTTKIDYSNEGWPWRVTNPDGTTVRATYDGEGNVIQVENEIGSLTKTRYTIFDKPEVIIDSEGGETRLVYDTQMQVVSLINSDGRTWDFVRDIEGEVCEERDYNGIVTRFEQNVAEGWTKAIDAEGGITTQWQDAMGRVIQETSSDGIDTIYTYDRRGYIDEIANDSSIVKFAWNQNGQFVGEYATLLSGESFGVEPKRDQFGRVSGSCVNLPDGRKIMQSVSLEKNSDDATSISIQMSDRELAHIGLGYDAVGNRSYLSSGSIFRKFEFDSRGRTISDVVGKIPDEVHSDPALMAGRSWAWRPDNVVTAVNDLLSNVAKLDVDTLGRVTAISSCDQPEASSIQGQKGVEIEKYGYSPAGVLEQILAPQMADEDNIGLAKSARAASSEGADSNSKAQHVDFRGSLVTRVGKTAYKYDKLGRVIETVTRRTSLKPVVKRFKYHGSTGQVSMFTSSDAPNLRWLYSYDGLGRRVAKTCEHISTGDIVSREVFVHSGNNLVSDLTTVSGDAYSGHVWVSDPSTNEIIGQVELKPTRGRDEQTQSQTDGVFYALVSDLAGAPRELVDPETGQVVGRSTQSLFGRRSWKGISSPLLFAGQYEDCESGWVYNRYRFYDPKMGAYGAQDPLGVGPNFGSAQGYVSNPLTHVDLLGLAGCEIPAGVEKINGRYPINAKYAGDTYTFKPGSDLARKYPNGVEFTEKGFPKFEPHTHHATVKGPDGTTLQKAGDVKIDPGKSRSTDFARADKELGIDKAYRKQNGLVWHHHQDQGRMILMPKDLHNGVKHSGGYALWGAGKKG